MTTEAPTLPVEAGTETPDAAAVVRARPGRRPLPEGERIKYRDERVSMRGEYFDKLHEGAEALDVVSLSGKHRNQPSWRAMLRFLSENMDWIILAVRMLRRMNPQDLRVLWAFYEREDAARKALAEVQKSPVPVSEIEAEAREDRIRQLVIELDTAIYGVTVTVKTSKAAKTELPLAMITAP